MKVLVTGANGYIGRKVVQRLVEFGCDVVATDFSCDQIESKCVKMPCDLFSIENPFEYFGKPDSVVHLAWKDGFNHASLAHLDYLPNHFNFCKKFADAGVKKLNVMGSMHEVGFYEGAIDENTVCKPLSLYGVAKNALREALFTLKTDCHISWMRGFYIYGNDEKNNSIFTKLLQKEKEGQDKFPFTDGLNKYDFISIENLATEIVLVSIQSSVTGIVNVCSGHPLSLKDMVEDFISKNHLKIRLEYGAFPNRPYDSKLIYGDTSKIKQIVNECEYLHNSNVIELKNMLR